MRQVPCDRRSDPLLERYRRLPPELRVYLRGVDGVSPVVPGAVFHESDEIVAFAERLKEKPDDVDVRAFCISADIVRFAGASVMEHAVDRRTMIAHEEPVTHIEPVAIDREGLAVDRVRDHERNEFLGKLVRAVVI